MRYIKIIIIMLLGASCQNMDKNSSREAVSRVNDTYLYKDDIEDIVPLGTSKEDSVNMVNNYINRWATKQLFIDHTKRNLTESKLNEFNSLVEDYKNTLYINAYKDAVINQSMNMLITEQDMEVFYSENIENFNLYEELVKLRYLHLPPDYDDIVATKQEFNRYNEEDKIALEQKKLEFVRYSFNDSLWVSLDQVLDKIPILKKQDRNGLLRKGKYIKVKDSIGIYMVKIEAVTMRNEKAPLDYIKPTIRQIILNKRKLELIKNLEKDITKDAIKNKQFEVYN